MKAIKIVWTDAAVSTEYHKKKDIGKEFPMPIVTSVGFLVEESAESVYIAQSYCDEEWAEVLVVPRGMIQSISAL